MTRPGDAAGRRSVTHGSNWRPLRTGASPPAALSVETTTARATARHAGRMTCARAASLLSTSTRRTACASIVAQTLTVTAVHRARQQVRVRTERALEDEQPVQKRCHVRAPRAVGAARVHHVVARTGVVEVHPLDARARELEEQVRRPQRRDRRVGDARRPRARDELPLRDAQRHIRPPRYGELRRQGARAPRTACSDSRSRVVANRPSGRASARRERIDVRAVAVHAARAA